MATATHIPTRQMKAQGALTSGQAVNLGSDTFRIVALKAGSGIPVTEYFSNTAITGSTHSNTTIDTLSTNPVTAGVLVNMAISGSGIPANTYITAVTSASITLSQAATATASGVALTITGGVQFVADLTLTNPEDTLISARLTLSSVTWAFDSNGTQVDYSFANIVYAQNAGDDGLSRYFAIYDSSVGSGDSTYPVLAVLDPNQLISTVNGSQTLQCPTGGLLQYTGGG